MVPPLSPEEAADLHLASLRAVCEQLRTVIELERVLVATPDDHASKLAALIGKNFGEVWPQGDGSLGRRMCVAMERAFRAGTEAVLLLGADSPTVPKGYFKDAVSALDEHDAVIGASHDGGYYLLGMRRPMPFLFEGIEWGSPRVAEQTRERASEAFIDLTDLPEWYDLDRFEDLRRAQDDLSRMELSQTPSAAALKRQIDRYVERYCEWKN